MSKDNSPQEIERILSLMKKFKETYERVDSVPTLEKLTREQFKQEAATVDYTSYVSSAHFHYQVARLRFIFQMHGYALFCSQQTVETYLKAYLKKENVEPPMSHSLEDLLGLCRSLGNRPAFIDSPYIEIIVQKFDPYNEVARYPVQRTRPEFLKGWFSVFPEDMHILDYFIYKMREVIQLPDSNLDLFKSGVHIQCPRLREDFPYVWGKLTEENINFDS